MHLRLFDYTLWFSGTALQIGILVVMYARGLHRDYPFFARYQLLQVLSEPVLFAVQRHSYTLYYWGYWISTALSALVSAAVLYEVARALFRRGARLSQRTAVVFITLVSMMAAGAAVAAVMWAITLSHSASFFDESTNAILLAQRSVRLLQYGLTLLLMMFWKSLRMPHRDPGFGIMLGFAVFAIVSFTVGTVASQGTFVSMSVLRQINMAAYDVAVMIWLASVLRAPGQTRWAEFRIAI
jgi:hypothetical protein